MKSWEFVALSCSLTSMSRWSRWWATRCWGKTRAPPASQTHTVCIQCVFTLLLSYRALCYFYSSSLWVVCPCYLYDKFVSRY